MASFVPFDTANQSLKKALKAFVDMTELLLLKRKEVSSYDFAQFVHMMRLLHQQKYAELSIYSHFDTDYNKYGLDANKLHTGLKAVVEAASRKEVPVEHLRGSDDHHFPNTDKTPNDIDVGGDMGDDEENDDNLVIDKTEIIDVRESTPEVDLEHMFIEGNSIVEPTQFGDELGPRYDDLLEHAGGALSIDREERSTLDASGSITGGKGGRHGPAGFIVTDQAIYFKTLAGDKSQITMEHVDEILGVSSEADLDKLIDENDDDFAARLSKDYGITVHPSTYPKPTEADKKDLDSKVKYLLAREAAAMM